MPLGKRILSVTSKKKKWDGELRVNTSSRVATLSNEDGEPIDQDSWRVGIEV